MIKGMMNGMMHGMMKEMKCGEKDVNEMKWNCGCCVVEKDSLLCPTNKMIFLMMKKGLLKIRKKEWNWGCCAIEKDSPPCPTNQPPDNHEG